MAEFPAPNASSSNAGSISPTPPASAGLLAYALFGTAAVVALLSHGFPFAAPLMGLIGIAGLIASTVVVAWTASATESWSPGLRSMALPFANLATFGALWIVQFVLLERVIFREDRGPLGVLG